MMRLLVIEDETEWASAILDALRSFGVEVEVTIATNRDEALAIISGPEFFDVAVCDLRIPPALGGLDADPAFGREVYATLRAQRQGTPVFVFSAYSDEDFLESLIETQHRGDPYGSGTSFPMVRAFRKLNMASLVTALTRVSEDVRELGLLDVATQGQILNLTPDEERLVRIAARRAGGTTAKVVPMSAGLSGARVMLVTVIDRFGARVAQFILKVGYRANLGDESQRYHAHVPLVLPAGGFAPLAMAYSEGSGRLVGLGYSLAVADPQSFGAALRAHPNSATGIISRLQAIEEPWVSGSHAELMSVDQLCEDVSSAMAACSVVEGLDPSLGASLRAVQIQVRRSVQHGDLHVGNVLIGPESEVVMIDYGRTGPRVAAYDPVSLELCLVFHPDGRTLCSGWPSLEQAARFDDLDFYVAGCPMEDFVRGCRAWAFAVANGDRDVYGCVLAYCIRQLTFPDTDHHLAESYVIRAARRVVA